MTGKWLTPGTATHIAIPPHNDATYEEWLALAKWHYTESRACLGTYAWGGCYCTREKGHRGMHIARGGSALFAVWEGRCAQGEEPC